LIQAPTSIIVGSRGAADILLITDTLVATLRHVFRIGFDGAAHAVNLEQPERFTPAIEAFLPPVPPHRH